MDDFYKMVSVAEILQTVEYSCDFGFVSEYPGDTIDDQRTRFWADVIETKAGDTGFGHLVNSIIENGFTSAIGWNERTKGITEGHHRLVAAILLGMDEVPTCEWGDNYDLGISAHWNADPAPIKVEVY